MHATETAVGLMFSEAHVLPCATCNAALIVAWLLQAFGMDLTDESYHPTTTITTTTITITTRSG
jgi:hypothetical protein